MNTLSTQEALANLSKHLQAKPRTYLSMYSSLFDGIVTDPNLMLVPLDDHMCHRGDAVFEALRCIDGALYDVDAHLKRLEKSAQGISLALTHSHEDIKKILIHCVKASGAKNGTLRVFVSRGPGDFSPNPYSTIGTQIYVVYTSPAPYADSLYEQGAKLGLSEYHAKPKPFCTIKSCNYLTNVLMKKESIDRKLDFVIASTEAGEITESATENIAVVTQKNELIAPPFENMLKGTTLMRVLDLAKTHAQKLKLQDVKQQPLSVDDLLNAQTMLVIGTTMGIMPVQSFENKIFMDPKKLLWLKPLCDLFDDDIKTNHSRRTEVF